MDLDLERRYADRAYALLASLVRIYPPDRTPKRRVLSVDDGARPMVGARG
jgi:hypothetical protein